MVRTRLERLAALEARQVSEAHDAMPEALDRLISALEASFPSIPGTRVQSSIYSHAYSTVAYVSTWDQINKMARRLRAGTDTPDDCHTISVLNDDDLNIMGTDARGFVEMLLSLDEKI